MNDESNAQCALCCTNAPLQQSHVLPAFIFRWLRESSATGHMRFGEAPNKRVQDGIKLQFLCAECEGKLSKFETAFAKNLFHPWNADSSKRIQYGDWLLKFCVSISWRVLKYFQVQNGLDHFGAEQKKFAEIALDRWSKFILGIEPHPGIFEQHLLPLDAVVSYTIESLPDNINRYLLRGVGMDLPVGEKSAFTYAKMGKFALFGYVQPPAQKWRGTKVHVRTGIIGPSEYELPAELMDYIADRAARSKEIYSKISKKQRDRIESDLVLNVDRWKSSATLEAMLHDERLFGMEALLHRPTAGEKDKP